MFKTIFNKNILIFVLFSLVGLFGFYLWIQNKELKQQLSLLDNSINSINSEIQKISKNETDNKESVRRLSLSVTSKQNQLTDTVSKAASSVVSIVISKEVPQLEVAYVNPFGDDPLFQGFNIQVPVYQQKGVTKKKVGAGSGFIVSSNGYIVTNKHVVSDTNAEYTVLLPKGEQKTATVVYRDPNNDMAIIKISGSYSALPLGDSGLLQPGQSVIAIGNALGEFNNSVSVGVISGLNRTIDAQNNNGTVETLKNIIQTDAAINPGNSGGPLLDLNGNVVGVNVATASGSNSISFSIPINTLKGIINSHIK